MPSKKIQILGSMTSGTVRHDVVQELTEEEKLQARENINAASLDENGKIPVEQLPDGIGSGEGGVTSWNDLQDKPFYEDGWSVDWDLAPTDTYIQPGFIIEWDGSDTGTSVVIPENEDLGITSGAVFYKVSDNIESLAGCTIVCNTHTEEYEDVVNITPEEVGSFYDTDGNIIGTYAMSSTVVALNIEQAATATIIEGVEVVFPAPGLYFRTDNECRVFNLYNAIYELFADGKLYKISDSVNTTLSGSRLGIVVDGQTAQELTIESGGEFVLVEQNDGSSAALPYIVNTLADNTTFNLSDLAGFPLVITVPKAGLYMFDIASMFELPEGSSMHLSNTQVVKIDSKFLPNSGCPTYSGGQLMSRGSEYIVYNQQALFASLIVDSDGNIIGIDFKKGCYNIPADATEFIISFSGSNLTLENNLTISVATRYLGGQDLDAYASDISVEISGLKSLKSGSQYTVYCVYSKSQNKWDGTVISSTGSDYTLPVATATTLGGIKVGENLSINNGVLSAIIPSLDWYNISSKPSLYTQSQVDTKLDQIDDKFSQVDTKLGTKQDTSNFVTSIGSTSTNSQYPSAKAVYDKLLTKQDVLTFDNTPISNSVNPITSGGVRVALDGVVKIAEGKCSTYIFDYYDTLYDVLVGENQDVDFLSSLHAGDIFLIRDLKVPDYWWEPQGPVLMLAQQEYSDIIVDGYGAARVLETTKIDLTGYAKIEDIPKNLSELTSDSIHRLVTDDEKNIWNEKSNFSGDYNDLVNKPTIPSSLPANGGNADTVDNYHIRTAAEGDTGLAGYITFIV